MSFQVLCYCRRGAAGWALPVIKDGKTETLELASTWRIWHSSWNFFKKVVGASSPLNLLNSLVLTYVGLGTVIFFATSIAKFYFTSSFKLGNLLVTSVNAIWKSCKKSPELCSYTLELTPNAAMANKNHHK